MQNVDLKVKGNTLTLIVDLSKDNGPSASGKTHLVASTQGNAEVPGYPNVRVGLNVFRYPDKGKKGNNKKE